ncbi:MAG: (Na+)-NQR maturation NqrM [bacterium]|nr:(Na+)-NQR maturation NqrM [bacterium]
MITTVLLTVAIFAFIMLIMAVGVIMRRPCLRGSCGGPEVLGTDGEPLTCATCPNRKRREREKSLPVVEAKG